MRRAVRATIVHCLRDPGESDESTALEVLDDGILVIENGRVAGLGDAAAMQSQLGDTAVEHLAGKIIVPGFIDCHVHFPQLDIIASHGEQLLDWLEKYAFPCERRFADRAYAAGVAETFLDELLRNGTTTAAVFASVYPKSADALFEAARTRGMRLIAGKVLMDRECPEDLRDSPESGYADSKALLEKWHGKDRLGYAITPRFALTSSEAQLAAAGRLAAEFPDCWVHTHLSENLAEVRQVGQDFPDDKDYLSVYDRHGLVRERSVFAHCLHLSDRERHRLAECGGAAAFCPTSNLFLGSGLFDLDAMNAAKVRVGLGTDVGGGTSLSLLATATEAYKVLQLQNQTLPASRALYLATLGGARALYLDDKIGNFEAGKEADFVVLDPHATPLSRHRTILSENIRETLFALLVLGDDRHVDSTYVMGKRCQ